MLMAIPLTTLSLSAADVPLARLKEMTARFAPAALRVNTSRLSAGDRTALQSLSRPGGSVDRIFLQQLERQPRSE